MTSWDCSSDYRVPPIWNHEPNSLAMAPARAPRPPGAGGPARPPDGDLAAVVRPHFEPMSRASRRILRDDALADDAIQETLLSFWSRPERPENPRAWLLRAVTLRSLHLARARRRRREHEERASLGRPEGTTRDDPARSLDGDDLARVVGEALGRLAEEYRAAFLLRAVEGRDYESIAAALDLPIGTVRSRLSRARRLLRAQLAEAGAGPDH